MAGIVKQKRLGIFGGTFDPPHLGHLILASECMHQLGLDRVLWVLTPTPPHKSQQGVSSSKQRLALLEAALETSPEFEFCPVDLERPAPHYAVDTMQILREQYPDADLVYIMGLDSLRDLPAWHKPELFVQSVDLLGVVSRPGVTPQINQLIEQFPGLANKISLVPMPEIGISSRDIRRRIKAGLPYRFFLPQAVYDLIRKEKYYSPNGEENP